MNIHNIEPESLKDASILKSDWILKECIRYAIKEIAIMQSINASKMKENSILSYLIPPFLVFGMIYLICAFIAWDMNPENWYLFQTWFGRICIIIIVITGINAVLELYEENL